MQMTQEAHHNPLLSLQNYFKGELHLFISGLPSKIFIQQAIFGILTGDYVVDKTLLGYLNAVVDICETDFF